MLSTLLMSSTVHHTALEVSLSGLVIHTSFLHMGASPDAVVNCVW